MADPELDAAAIARRIATSPRLRAKFFKNADRVIVEAVPSKRSLSLGVDPQTKNLRREVLAKVPEALEEKPEIASSAHAEAVMQQFFEAAIRNPELSFVSILGLSLATFVVGVALVVASLVTVFVGDDNSRNTVIAGVFGGSGVAGTLGSVYTLARRGVSLANANHAQIRLVLTGFATELGHLRALHLEDFDDVGAVNDKTREAMTRAVDLIQTRVKVEPTGGESGSDSELGLSAGRKEGE